MTLIKCFTRSHINNIAACLQLMPEKLILVGDGASMKESVRRYRRRLQRLWHGSRDSARTPV